MWKFSFFTCLIFLYTHNRVTERNSVLNIYDLAGNILEWTLEGVYARYPNVVRGGYCYTQYNINASSRSSEAVNGRNYYNGFRATLW